MAKKKTMSDEHRRRVIRQRLIEGGVKNLKEFGYPGVSEENIITDEVYSRIFVGMLRDNLGHGFDKEINQLISECPRQD